MGRYCPCLHDLKSLRIHFFEPSHALLRKESKQFLDMDKEALALAFIPNRLALTMHRCDKNWQVERW
jgi:hypothetical protein